MLDFLLLWRFETTTRPEAHRSKPLLATFAARRDAALASLEQEAPELERSAFSIGHVAIGCALSYLDFRFPATEWRKSRPGLTAWYATFADRPSARATTPVDDS
jgi:glutathione S-transferase